MRIAQLALLLGVYFTAVYRLLVPVQLHLWNALSAVDVVVMAGLILPFVLMPILVRWSKRATKYAWGIMTFMALDLVFLQWESLLRRVAILPSKA